MKEDMIEVKEKEQLIYACSKCGYIRRLNMPDSYCFDCMFPQEPYKWVTGEKGELYIKRHE